MLKSYFAKRLKQPSAVKKSPKMIIPSDDQLLYGLVDFRNRLCKMPLNLETDFLKFCFRNYELSISQIFQDLMVLFFLDEKRDGFFVEFGATNGITLSNSYLLESRYAWRGILAEPAQCWHQQLRGNRKAGMDFRCVWSETGHTLAFNEIDATGLSTVEQFSARDGHANKRLNPKQYTVETISLSDLLQEHNAPSQIDYMSVDTEGSEYAILKAFDFSRWDISIISVEHNYIDQDRQDIHELLTRHQYVRVLKQFSHFDDWYVKKSLLQEVLKKYSVDSPAV